MATKREPATGRYRVLRPCGVGETGDVVQLAEDEAALLIRDGMVTPVLEGGSQ